MKILQIAPYFLPYLGGQERHVYDLSRSLLKLGHEVTVLTSNVPRGARYQEIDGIKVFRYAAIARPFRNPITPSLLMLGKKLRGFDVIHAHNEHSFAALAAVYLKRRLGLPLVIGCHGHGQSLFDNQLVDALDYVYTRSVGRTILNQADRIALSPPSEKDFLVKLGVKGQRMVIIPAGVSLERWAPYLEMDAAGFLKKHSLEGKKMVLVATQIIRRKGIEYMIKAIPQIVEACPEAVCLIAGSGDYLEEARRLAQELNLGGHVRFLGRLDDQQLALAYRSADVFVLPSLLEGQPVCVMEAFLFSKPVVATDIEGTRDYFKESAVLVPPRDSAALAAAISRLLDDSETAQRMGQRGRVLVESRFTWQRLGAEFVSLYEDVIREKGR